MYTRRIVLGGRIHSQQFQRHISRVEELVLSPGRDDDKVPRRYFLFLPSHDGPAIPMGENQDLVYRVDLFGLADSVHFYIEGVYDLDSVPRRQSRR